MMCGTMPVYKKKICIEFRENNILKKRLENIMTLDWFLETLLPAGQLHEQYEC